MISKKLKEHLLSRDKKDNLAFAKLVEFLEESEFEFIGSKLRGPMGLATYKKAYFDLSRFESVDDQLVFFVILHEYCHVLNIDKIGKDEMIKQLSSNNFDEFLNHIIHEEILADRFGSLMYYHYNNKLYPKYRTQMLEHKEQRDKYTGVIDDLFGVIKDEETYDKLLNSFVIDELD